MCDKLSPVTKNALDTIWTELTILDTHCLHDNEHVRAAAHAIRELRLKLLPKWYVFECMECDVKHSAQVEELPRLLESSCNCQDGVAIKIFTEIAHKEPKNCYIYRPKGPIDKVL